MADLDRLQVLESAHDTLQVLLGASEPQMVWVDTHRQYIFAGSLRRLTQVGFDVSDFVVPDASIDSDGEVLATAFWIHVNLAFAFVKRQIARMELANRAEATPESEQLELSAPVTNAVFVVHGRDVDAKDMVFALLREVGLSPSSFDEARRLVGRPMPYIGEVLEAAFKNAQAVLVLFTPDERVELVERLRPREQAIVVEHQPRPNVLIEAGIALATHPDRVVIVEMGTVRNISDLAGRHMVRIAEDTPQSRSELLDRLEEAGCQPVREGSR